MQADTAYPDPLQALDLRNLLGTIWRGRWLIALSTVTVSCIAVAYALLTSPTYRAEALVQVRQDPASAGPLSTVTSQLGGLADLAGLGNAGNPRALALATLRSRVVIQAFIERNNLLPKLYPGLWDAESRHWKVSDPTKQPTAWHGYRTFSEQILKITEDKKSGLVTVAVDWRDPAEAATWVTELIALANTSLRERAILESERNLEYLRQHLRQTGLVELQRSVYTLVESELNKLMLAKGGEEYALKTIDPAQPPRLPIRPKRQQIAVIGFALGLALGMLAVFVADFLRRLYAAGPVTQPSNS